jgi:hypothetical protein
MEENLIIYLSTILFWNKLVALEALNDNRV